MLKYIQYRFKILMCLKFSKNHYTFARIASVLSKDQLTDKPERFFVNETIREKSY
jgi:GTPase Era involved in 16S rRNA processing